MKSTFLAAIAVAVVARPTPSPSPTRVDYTLRIDSLDPAAASVTMQIRGAPAEFRVAMATHPEYDDKYWRYLTDLTVTGSRGTPTAIREDSAVWHVTGAAGDITLRYRVRYPVSPPEQQAAWKAHATADGGLIGGPHSFLYVVGSEPAPVRVAVALPRGWDIATGLAPAGGRGEFTAPDAETLIDSPILVGHLRRWRFTINGVPHDIAYLGQPGGVPFDSALFVSNVERIARETVKLFGWMPYRRYQFLFEGGTQGALEHLNSVSLAVRTAAVARDPDSPLAQIAHEFFHTWNEVHLRPASWIGIRHVMPAPNGELWWAEGVTLYYADLLLRRAGLHTQDSTRLTHLERLITVYNANPSHGAVSLEQTSRGFNLPPGVNGDYTPSMYTQGEVVGAMLDMIIRSESGGRRSLDDVMRDLAMRYTPKHGYTGTDVERAVSTACSCDARSFFSRYVRAANPIDFDHVLVTLGLRAIVTWEPARAEFDATMPDVRVSGFLLPGEQQPRLQIWFPSTAWGRAGLHTGDQVVSWNGTAMTDAQQLRTAISQLHLGDTVRVAVRRDSGPLAVLVAVGGYDRPVVRVGEIPGATAAQRAIRAKWMAGQ